MAKRSKIEWRAFIKAHPVGSPNQKAHYLAFRDGAAVVDAAVEVVAKAPAKTTRKRSTGQALVNKQNGAAKARAAKTDKVVALPSGRLTVDVGKTYVTILVGLGMDHNTAVSALINATGAEVTTLINRFV